MPEQHDERDVTQAAGWDETGLMEPQVVTVTIRDDAPRPDGTWAAVDAWGREVFVTLRAGSPGLGPVSRGQAVRGIRRGHTISDAVL